MYDVKADILHFQGLMHATPLPLCSKVLKMYNNDTDFDRETRRKYQDKYHLAKHLNVGADMRQVYQELRIRESYALKPT